MDRLKDRPWAELRQGKAVTELWLARRRRPYNIRPRTIWQGGRQAKGYMREDFHEVIRRYLPDSEFEDLLAPKPPPSQPVAPTPS